MTPLTPLAAAGPLFGIGAVLMFLGERRHHADADRVRSDWIKYVVYVGVIGTILAALSFSRILAVILLLTIVGGGAREIHHNLAGSALRRGLWTIAFAAAVAASLSRLLSPCGPVIMLLVAACDAFSQLWGRLVGRHPLCPRISPAKTVEGLAGGVLSTVLVALWIGRAAPEAIGPWALLGLAVALAATCGDLLFSALKRRLRIKDFAATLPGHGGFLDRFDSLIVAAPIAAWLAGWIACR
jgi:CDP-diglyceride synthetase